MSGTITSAVVCIAALLSAAAHDTTTIADLDALAGQRAWLELLDKAQSLPAATRGAHWQELVNQAAQGRMNDRSVADDAAALEATTLLQRYPGLADDRLFMTARGQRSLDAARRALETRDDTRETRASLLRVVVSDPTNFELARDAGILIAHHVSPKAEVVDYFDVALNAAKTRSAANDANTKALCSSPELGAAVRDALTTDTSYGDVAAKRLARAKVIAFDTCFSGLDKPALVTAIMTSEHGPKNACSDLLRKDLIKGGAKCKRAN